MIGAPTLARAQDRLLVLLGSAADRRADLVSGMLRRDPKEGTSYWLQLFVSMGIATFGLVVGSTAVIIGAMLIAPLMGPIVGLAMGLAAGSPYLVLRSAGRVGGSVIVAVGGAAAITALVPFHELNAEIQARTSPTVLDLLTASFCALAGVYASVRPGSDTATTAAGTSIGISLVPPLCASGYGIGTGSLGVAGGAALLFLTNMVAIVVVGTVAFVVAGFTRVDVARLEREELAQAETTARISAALARRLAKLFESRVGPVLRFLMPFVLLAAVYVPLRRALDEVAWQVRVRGAIQAALEREPARVVQSRARVEGHRVELALVIVGTNADAVALHTRLDAEVRQVSGVAPHVGVIAIPDADAVANLESNRLTPVALSAPPPPSPAEQLDRGRALVRTSVTRQWPSTAAGEPLAIELGTAPTGPLRVRVVHLGAALSTDASEGLTRALATELGRPVTVIDAPIPPDELTRAAGDLALVSKVMLGVRSSVGVGAIAACVTTPPGPPPGAWHDPREVELARSLDDVLAQHPRVTRTGGAEWRVRFVAGECAVADAGASDAAAE